MSRIGERLARAIANSDSGRVRQALEEKKRARAERETRLAELDRDAAYYGDLQIVCEDLIKADQKRPEGTEIPWHVALAMQILDWAKDTREILEDQIRQLENEQNKAGA